MLLLVRNIKMRFNEVMLQWLIKVCRFNFGEFEKTEFKKFLNKKSSTGKVKLMTYSLLSNDLLGVTHYDLREDAFHLILILLQI